MYNSLVLDISAFVVLISLIRTTALKKMNKGHTNFIFYLELIVCTLSAFFNIIFNVTTLFFPGNILTVILAYFCKYMYFAANSFVMPITVLYLLSSVGISSIFERKEIFKVIFVISILIPLCFVLDNLFSHRMFYIAIREISSKNPVPKLEYVENGFVNHFYGVICVYLIISLILLIHYRKFLTQSKVIIGFTLFPVYFFIFLYQLRHSHIETLSFVYAISCYLVITTSQRPEVLINSASGVWSEFSFYKECKKGYLLDRPESVILIKIKNYQNLNLYLGQENYNRIIKTVTSKFSMFLKYFKQEDNLYYLDDFSFAVLMDSVSEQDLSLISGELQYELSQELNFKEFKIIFKPSVCVVKLPSDLPNYDSFTYFSKNFQNILPQSEKVLYLSDFIKIKEFKIKNEISLILDRAVKEKTFEVFYQPIYGVKEEKFISAEALIRLKDPEYGYILPSIFLPNAEESGLIHELGDFVLETVCQFICSKQFEELGLQYIEINLSQTQCMEENFVTKIIGTLDKYNVPYNKIRLEITESVATSNSVLVENNLRQLTDAGVLFALDNYGTGYSNMKTVTQLPFTVIKFDKSFVENIKEKTMWIVIHDTIAMLKKLNKEILVTGIEDEESVKIFKELKCDLMQGCEYIQGYVFSEPVPEQEFIKRVKKFNGID